MYGIYANIWDILIVNVTIYCTNHRFSSELGLLNKAMARTGRDDFKPPRLAQAAAGHVCVAF
jgi:hypothetical protein